MGKAQRAHRSGRSLTIDGGHGASAPLPTLRSGSRHDAGVDVPCVVDAVDSKSKQAKELALVFRKVCQFVERFRGEKGPPSQHLSLNFAVRMFKMVPPRPSFDAYIDRSVARPAFQRAEKIAAG